jgi:hypothetical protein
VNYLGHVIRPGKLAVAEKNTSALKDAQPPATQSELRSFLGLCNVYRRFVPGFAKVAAPLNKLLRKGESQKLGVLTEEQLKAFDALRARLLDPPVLALPRADGRYVLDTDASQEQIGCCLLQEHPDCLRHPVGYWSRALTSAERNYSTTEQECLAIVSAILQLRPYLEGQKFIIRMDHHSLRWVLNLSDAQGRLARWRLRLLEFDFEVQYSPGREHHGADMMSRLCSPNPNVPVPTEMIDTEIPCSTVEAESDPTLLRVEDLVHEQLHDPECLQLSLSLGIGAMLDRDGFGTLGRVLPSGEFEVILPKSVAASTPLTVVQGTSFPNLDTCPCVRGDAHHLRREEYKGIQDNFSKPSAIVASTEVLGIAAR